MFSSKDGDRPGTFEVEGTTVTMNFTNPTTEADKKPITGKLSDNGNAMTVTGRGTPP